MCHLFIQPSLTMKPYWWTFSSYGIPKNHNVAVGELLGSWRGALWWITQSIIRQWLSGPVWFIQWMVGKSSAIKLWFESTILPGSTTTIMDQILTNYQAFIDNIQWQQSTSITSFHDHWKMELTVIDQTWWTCFIWWPWFTNMINHRSN